MDNVPRRSVPEKTPEPPPEKMQVDSQRLSPEERNRCKEQRLCLYCRRRDHFIRTCPSRPPRLVVSSVLPQSSVSTPLTISGNLKFIGLDVEATAIVDSGSAGNFISGKFVKTHRLQRTRTSKPYSIYAVTGEIINKGYVTSQIAPITLSIEP